MDHSTTQEEIRLELTELKIEVKHLREGQDATSKLVNEMHARMLSTPTCPSPGLCVLLQQQGSDRENRLRQLERRDAYVVGACAILSFGVPLAMKFFLKI